MNSNKFHFSDFTIKHYWELLTEVKKRYRFIDYTQIIQEPSRSVLWRHDVDMSMSNALKIARIENSMGIKSAYFILLHSEFYNLLENSVKAQVEEIISLGHSIGLHFDFSYYKEVGTERLESNLYTERSFVEKTFKTKVNSFSFHNPTAEVFSFDEFTYAGMVNSYSKQIRETFHYCSDSNGYWRHERMYDTITKVNPRNLHALTHPIWWTEEIASPEEKILNCIRQRSIDTQNYYVALLTAAGRNIIGP